MSLGCHVLGGSVGLVLVACGGVATDGSDSPALVTCSISAGSYTQHFTTGPAGLNCPDIPDRTVTITGNEAITGTEVTAGAGSFGLTDGGPGCVSGADSDTCTFTTQCKATASGVASETSTAITFNGASATGAEATRSTDPAGKVLSSCNYDITVTKQ
jgi:hypothetical protein